MNLDQEAVAKAVYVGLLLLFIAACDLLHVNDTILRNTAFGLIGTIATWHGVMKFTGANNLANQTLQQVLAMLQPPVSGIAPAAVAAPADETKPVIPQPQ
jgi:hypothetical protein